MNTNHNGGGDTKRGDAAGSRVVPDHQGSRRPEGAKHRDDPVSIDVERLLAGGHAKEDDGDPLLAVTGDVVLPDAVQPLHKEDIDQDLLGPDGDDGGAQHGQASVRSLRLVLLVLVIVYVVAHTLETMIQIVEHFG
jgi:hypothetical protein